MKKILLGTSALIGASVLLAGPAFSAEKPKLGMDGYLRFEAWGGDQDLAGANRRDYAFETDDVEIHFFGSSKADNGLEYGFYVELQETGSSNTAYDEANVFLAGGWGRLDLGSQDAVHNNYKMGAYAISADKDGAWDGNVMFNTSGSSAYIGTDFFGGDDSNKITYTTPTFAGFTVGVSLTPGTDEQFNSNFGNATPTGAANDFFPGGNGAMNNQVGVGAQYKATFGAVGVEANARYAQGEYKEFALDDREDAEAYGIGAKVTFAGFSIAGSWQDLGDSGLTATQRAAGADTGGWWDIGVAYGTGPYKVSVIYMQSEANDAAGAEDKIDWLQIGAGYAVAPGLDLYVAYQYVDLDNGGTTADNEANMFLLGTQVSF